MPCSPPNQPSVGHQTCQIVESHLCQRVIHDILAWASQDCKLRNCLSRSFNELSCLYARLIILGILKWSCKLKCAATGRRRAVNAGSHTSLWHLKRHGVPPHLEQHEGKVIVIDNYDSFTYNLSQARLPAPRERQLPYDRYWKSTDPLLRDLILSGFVLSQNLHFVTDDVYHHSHPNEAT